MRETQFDRNDLSGDVAKLYVDFFKHLTTLSTGTAVLFITVIDRLRPGLASHNASVVALMLLALSVLFSLMAMAGVADARHRWEQGLKRPRLLRCVGTYAQFVAPIQFAVAVGLIIYAATTFRTT